MRFTVLWDPVARDKLAQLWIQSPSRNAITQAANYIDRELRHDPFQLGESRDELSRVFIVLPLGVLIRIDEGDCKVHVLDVWEIEE